MAEWLILLLLIPAIVVPVVLLVGFAGCDRLLELWELTPTTSQPPVIKSAEGATLFHLR